MKKWILVLMCLFSSSAVASVDVHVFAVSSNQSFDEKLGQLKYADQDAKKFVEAMESVGLVPAARTVYLETPTRQEFLGAMAAFEQKFKISSTNSKFIFYYSGHSNEFGIHLRDGLITKAELHDSLAKINMNTKVAILDSCFSGALSIKGVQKSDDFPIPKMVFDEPSGSVFLTASSADQFSFESDALEGGVFTHHMLNGIYGAADGNSDGIVTIDELYQHVYKNTKWHSLHSSMSTNQEPEFVSTLNGRGAVSMSFPSQSTEIVKLAPTLYGDFHIRSKKGIQIFRLQKSAGEEKKLRLPIGRYQISNRRTNRIGLASLQVSNLRISTLRESDFKWSDVKGNSEKTAKGSVSSTKTANHKKSTKHLFALYAGVHSGYISYDKPGPNFGLSYFQHPLRWRFGSLGAGLKMNYHSNEADVHEEVSPYEQEEAEISTKNLATTVLLFANLKLRYFNAQLYGGGGYNYARQRVTRTKTTDTGRSDVTVAGSVANGQTLAREKKHTGAPIASVGINLFYRTIGDLQFGSSVQVDRIWAIDQYDQKHVGLNAGSFSLLVGF